MQKFCKKCGKKLDEKTGLCPNCDKSMSWKEKRMVKKGYKKATKTEKWAKLTLGQKIRKACLKFFLYVMLLLFLAGCVMGVLSFLGVCDIPFLSNYRNDKLLEFINEKSIVIEETNVVMNNNTEGTATIIVQMPNYEQLFKNASETRNPERYLLRKLMLKKYKTQEFEEVANVTVENNTTVIHSEEVVHKLLERNLINAINSLSEAEQ